MWSGEYNLNPRLRVGVFDQCCGTSGARVVYPGMKKIALALAAALLAVPARAA
jgi:hypothetical protein